MSLPFTIGFAALASASLAAFGTLLALRRRYARREHEWRRRLDEEQREERMRLREERSEMEAETERRRARDERAAREREQGLDGRERELARREAKLEDGRARLEAAENDLERREAELDRAKHETEKYRRFYRLKLRQLTQLDREAAKTQLMRATEEECENELRDLRRRLLDRSEKEIREEARRVLLASMQRLASQPMNDATATLVPIANEDYKGRIIGREGRNIRTFEHVTGTTLMIDETPDSVLISSFDPVRREVARIALEALLRDGRIHPASIEEEARRAEEEVRRNIAGLGEDTLRQLRLSRVEPEVVSVLGKLHYHLSNNQNTLAHCVEVARTCGLIAAELGMDATVAKRAGLLHDIGKGLDQEYEGSHAQAGAAFLAHHGEEHAVVNAAAAHHEETAAETAYAALVMVADSLSATRPGARASSMEGFIERVKRIEEMAREENGVDDAYAIQAGREVRVAVRPDKIGDEEARRLATRLRQRIESQLQYPGTIQITVIRERRFSETAV